MSDTQRHAGLQALRGIAVLFVFVQHIFTTATLIAPGPTQTLYSLSLGGIGVFIFFSLSAYLMSAKAAEPAAKFALDRARRIFPGLWLALGIGGLISHLIHGIPGLTWQIFLLLPFGDRPWVPVPYWTLYYEALLYLFIFLIARISPRLAGPAILLWAIIAWTWQDRPYGNGHYLFPTWYHLVFPIFAGYFAAGVVAVYTSRWVLGPAFRPILALLFLALAVAAFTARHWMLVPWIQSSWLVPRVLWSFLRDDFVFAFHVAGCYFALLAAMNWRAEGSIGRVLRRLGDQSYGIYLIHIAFMVGTAFLLKSFGVKADYFAACCIIGAAALPPSLAFGWAEHRLQLWIKAKIDRKRALRGKDLQPVAHVGGPKAPAPIAGATAPAAE
jgi:peptidoglycan/LPS O-acetylase OafA/YrhL